MVHCENIDTGDLRINILRYIIIYVLIFQKARLNSERIKIQISRLMSKIKLTLAKIQEIVDMMFFYIEPLE